MSQANNFPITAAGTTGTALAGYLNELDLSLKTMNSGLGVPSYRDKGTWWLDTTNPASMGINVWDGTQSVVIATLDGSGGVTYPVVDAALSDYFKKDGSELLGGSLTIGGSVSPSATLLPTGNGGYPSFEIRDLSQLRGQFYLDQSANSMHLLHNNTSGTADSEIVFKSGDVTITSDSVHASNLSVDGTLSVSATGEGGQLSLYIDGDATLKGAIDVATGSNVVRLINAFADPNYGIVSLGTDGRLSLSGQGTSYEPVADNDVVTLKYHTDNLTAIASNAASHTDSRVDTLQDFVNEVRLTARCKFSGLISGPVSPADGYNIATVEQIATGLYEVVFATKMDDKDYAIQLDAKRLSSDLVSACFANVDKDTTPSKTKFRVQIADEMGVPLTPESIYITISGGVS